jgi:hypothetical protein
VLLKKIMKATVLLTGLTLLCLSTIVSAEPFAPRANVPVEVANTYLGKTAHDSAIPTEKRVGIPTYPGAVVIRTFAVDKRPTTYKGLPVVEMISADDYQTVVDFYKKKLPSWRNAELVSAYYFAQNGHLNFFKPAEPHVGIHKMKTYFLDSDRKTLRKMLPGAQTLIKVFFAK